MSRRAAARAIRDSAAAAAARGRNVVRGDVVDTGPLVVELHATSEKLEEGDDFELGGLVELYDRDYGIAAGDVLVLMREGGEWTAIEVRPEDLPDGSLGQRIGDLEARVEALEGA